MRFSVVRFLWRRGILGRFMAVIYVFRFLRRIANRKNNSAKLKTKHYDYEVKK